MTSSARIPILDPALLTIAPTIPHFGRVFNELREVLSVERCNHHEVLLPPGHFEKDSLVLERLPDGLYLSPFLPETIHFPIWTGSSMKVLYEIRTLSNCE